MPLKTDSPQNDLATLRKNVAAFYGSEVQETTARHERKYGKRLPSRVEMRLKNGETIIAYYQEGAWWLSTKQ